MPQNQFDRAGYTAQHSIMVGLNNYFYISVLASARSLQKREVHCLTFYHQSPETCLVLSLSVCATNDFLNV